MFDERCPISGSGKKSRIFIVAGDPSGDVYGAQLVRELWKLDPSLEIAGLGGDRMAETGMELLYNLVREFSVMGFIRIVFSIPKVMRFLEIILENFAQTRPSLVILIDYPGFNLYLATHTNKLGIATIYYVTPQIWAWAAGRIKKIKERINKMLVIFPFEEEFYKKASIPVEYVGHPLLDRLAEFSPDPSFLKSIGVGEGEKILALLPGSRSHELKYNLRLMLKTAYTMLSQVDIGKIVIPLSHSKHLDLCRKIIATVPVPQGKTPTIVVGRTYDVISKAHFALVTSGTATLETAIFETPMVVIYKIPVFYHFVVKRFPFLHCQYIALPNIIAGREIVPEFLVSSESYSKIAEKAVAIWKNGEKREQTLIALKELKDRIKEPGASQKAAISIINFLDELSFERRSK